MSADPEPNRPSPALPAPRTVAIALVVDIAFVVIFAAIGRASHGEEVVGPDGLGLAQTTWPFLVALLVGWLTMRLWRFPLSILNAGVAVWLYTVIGGMLLRAISGQGVQTAFVIVASIVLAVFLVGWRVVVSLILRRRAPLS
ncbi:DUF3054 domain-containing protein [Microbacterium schleiferi]|jgi:hypothetical protein|uniref:DUF3054 domain-containing protein n=1 Tax=Microbacterium schleiferi TaxID=69362 RepID=UPI0035C7D348|tara:strand:+ start:1519 stop:1944 length:426 start_codon:yes stop_codon:yes gene_type:complete